MMERGRVYQDMLYILAERNDVSLVSEKVYLYLEDELGKGLN